VFRFVSVRTERKKIRFAGHPRGVLDYCGKVSKSPLLFSLLLSNPMPPLSFPPPEKGSSTRFPTAGYFPQSTPPRGSLIPALKYISILFRYCNSNIRTLRRLPHAKTTRRHTGSLRQKDNESDSDDKKYSSKRPLALLNLKYLLLYQQETFKFCSLLENLQMMKIFMIKILIFTFFYLRLAKLWLFFTVSLKDLEESLEFY
jgi:hypothetical protein